jgi:hypothetical protein
MFALALLFNAVTKEKSMVVCEFVLPEVTIGTEYVFTEINVVPSVLYWAETVVGPQLLLDRNKLIAIPV